MLNFKTKKLNNDIKLVTAPLNSTEAVSILVLVGVGGRFEPDSKRGISHFLEHLFFKGTKKYDSPAKLSEAIDGLGANYNAYTSEEYTGFYVQTASENLDKALDILSDMYLSPIFDKDEIEKEKGVILEEANMRRDVPQLYVQVLAQSQLFSNSPLGEDLVGRPESLKTVTRDDIKDYFENNYCGSSTIISLSGNAKALAKTKKVEDLFSKKKKGQNPKFQQYIDLPIKNKLLYEQRKVDQTHFVLSYRTFAKTDPRRYTMSLLSTIIGGGMSSRLFSEIREKRGLAYYVRSDTSSYIDTGAIQFSAGVKSDKFGDSLKVIFSEIESIKSKGVSQKELDRAKSMLSGKLALSLEGSLDIASYLAEETYYGPKIRNPRDIINNINKVTTEDVQGLAKQVFISDKMGLTAIGPKANTEIISNILKEEK